MATTTRTIEMANFASDGDSMTKTVSLPDYVDLQNVSVDVEAAGDLNSSSENFDYYLDGSLEGGGLSTGVQDCTYRDVWTNRDVTNYFDGKSSVQLTVNSSSATDEGFDCTGTAIKVKSVFTIDYVNTSPPSTPQNPASTYIADDQIDFSFGAPADWGGEQGDYDVDILRDNGSWENPSGGPSNPQFVDNKFGKWGSWRGDTTVTQDKDGFKQVGTADATQNTSYEDIFTGQFTTADYSNSGDGNYVYLAFAAKWNEIPLIENVEIDDWLKRPNPDPSKYQLYVIRSDGQNSRDEYFRLYYSSSNDTAFAEIADPVVWTAEDSDGKASIVGSSSNRTVTANVNSYGPNSDTSYGRQVGIDSSFKFRVRAQNSAGSSSWVTSETVYTTPIPPHNPSVSRPDANTVQIEYEVTSNSVEQDDGYYILDYREDSGSGYSNWKRIADAGAGRVSGNFSSIGDTVVLELTAGQTYDEGQSFSEDSRVQFRLRHEIPANLNYRSSEHVYADYGNEGNVFFEDDFESGDLSAWDSTNLDDSWGVVDASFVDPNASSDDQTSNNRVHPVTNPDEGSYYLFGDGYGSVTKNLGDLSGESDVIVKCAFAVGSMDSVTEEAEVQWYDGSNWQTLEALHWEYNRQEWIEITALVPDSYLSTNNKLRLNGHGGSGDYAAWDRVVVSDILHEYTKPAAPTNVSASGTSNSHEVSVSWDKQVASLSEAFQEVRVRVDGSGDPRDKYNVNLSSSATFNVNDGFDHTVPQRDGEQYEIRVDSLFQQFRHGTTEDYPRSVSGDTTAITKLPAPTSLSVSNIGTNSADLSWTDNHDYGDVEVQFKLDSDTTWTTDSTISIGTQSENLTSLSEATVYDARVLASTEHTTTEDI